MTVVFTEVPGVEIDDPQVDHPKLLDHAKNRGLVTPFLPGSIITNDAFVVDMYGIGWWIRPREMTVIQAGPPVRLRNTEDDESKPQ